MKIKIIMMLCLVFSVCGCGNKTPDSNIASMAGLVATSTQTSETRDYSILFPASWEVQEGVLGADLIGLSPMEGPFDTFRENINVVLEPVLKTMSSSRYLALTVANLHSVFGVPLDVKFTPTIVGKYAGYHLQYPIQIGSHKTEMDLYIVLKKQTWSLKNLAYIITCASAEGKRDAYKTRMDDVLNTFEIEGMEMPSEDVVQVSQVTQDKPGN